ncbi:MAG: HupE/UreJ family protein [Candidatus Competibacterales bacterium]
MLFVLGLLLLIRDPWRLLGAITAFTVAHSVTLATATLGWVVVPAPPVEAVIALSIVFLAAELLRRGEAPRLAERYPWLVAFAFGLLHGLGFAGALLEVGLPVGEVPLALLAFNVGVEVGQLLFIAFVVAVATQLRRIYPAQATAPRQRWRASKALHSNNAPPPTPPTPPRTANKPFPSPGVGSRPVVATPAVAAPRAATPGLAGQQHGETHQDQGLSGVDQGVEEVGVEGPQIAKGVVGQGGGRSPPQGRQRPGVCQRHGAPPSPATTLPSLSFF